MDIAFGDIDIRTNPNCAQRHGGCFRAADAASTVDAAREAVVEAQEQSRVVKATNTKATIALVIAAISVAVAVALYFLKGAF